MKDSVIMMDIDSWGLHINLCSIKNRIATKCEQAAFLLLLKKKNVRDLHKQVFGRVELGSDSCLEINSNYKPVSSTGESIVIGKVDNEKFADM